MTPDLLFTSLLRAGSSSSRKTVPTLWHPTYYLRHFCKAGRPVRERQCPFVTSDLLFASLRGGGLPSSREADPILGHLICYLLHFGEAIRPVRERWCRSRDAQPITYVTSGRRVTQFARDRAKVVTPDLLFTSFLRVGSLLLSASSMFSTSPS